MFRVNLISDQAVIIENSAGGSFHEFARTVFINDGVLTITFDDTGSTNCSGSP